MSDILTENTKLVLYRYIVIAYLRMQTGTQAYIKIAKLIGGFLIIPAVNWISQFVYIELYIYEHG